MNLRLQKYKKTLMNENKFIEAAKEYVILLFIECTVSALM